MLRWLMIACTGSAVALANELADAADVYPTKLVKIVVPFAAGGSTDLLTRSVAQQLNEAWKRSVIVENRAGGGGIVGSEYVVKSPPDGYVLLLGTNTTHAAGQPCMRNSRTTCGATSRRSRRSRRFR